MSRTALLIVFFYLIIFPGLCQNVNTADLDTLLAAINTRYDEQNPILSPDGNHLYFTRANDSSNVGGVKDKGDIWVARLLENGYWGAPENLGSPVNDDLKNYLLGFSPDGNIMFLNQEKRFPGGVVINDGIAFSVLSNGVWSRPVHVSVDYLLNKSTHQSGSVSADGNYMVLSMQSYASRGEEDIYISAYNNGKWTQPINLGSAINTSGQEMTPYLSPDNARLYFSSNGHGGKGGRDLFVSERTGDDWKDWSKPRNLGGEVNSFGVELNYFIDTRNQIAYFSSTQNSDGYGDIRAHRIDIDTPQPMVKEEVYTELKQDAREELRTQILSGLVYNSKTGEPMTAAINVTGNEVNKNANSGDDGRFAVEVPAKTSEVTVNIKAPGFMGITEQIAIDASAQNLNFELTPLEVGATIRLNKVYFERGTANLLNDSFDELNRVVDMMDENPDVKIELSGHTDNQGSSKLNLQLSQERVDMVEQYLIEHGINNKRIKGKGYGGTRPVASNASEETRKLNRRVEIKILKN